MCESCDDAVDKFGAGSQAALVTKNLMHLPTKEQIAARERLMTERWAASQEAEARREEAPALLEEAVEILRALASVKRGALPGECAVCTRPDLDHTHDCKLALFLARFP